MENQGTQRLNGLFKVTQEIELELNPYFPVHCISPRLALWNESHAFQLIPLQDLTLYHLLAVLQ